MKKKVLFYIPLLGYGGVERVVQYLSSAMASDYQVYIMGQGVMPGDLLSQAKLPENVQILPAPTSKDALKHSALWPQVQSILKVLNELKPDLILTAYPRVHLTLGMALLLYRGQRPRWVLTEHSEPAEYLGEDPLRSGLKAALLRLFVRRADSWIAVTQHIGKLCERLYAGSRFRTIYNPAVNPASEERAKEDPAHPWFTGQHAVIGCVVRLDPQKDVPTLLRAFDLVRRQRPEARLVILGEGECRAEIEALIKELGLSDTVWLPGFVENPYKYVARSAVFAFTSTSEASPIAVVEAMYLRRPMLLTNFATAKELVDADVNGLIVPMRDPQAVAQAILRLLDDPELCLQLGQKARQKVIERFSIERAVADYRQLFKDLLGA